MELDALKEPVIFSTLYMGWEQDEEIRKQGIWHTQYTLLLFSTAQMHEWDSSSNISNPKRMYDTFNSTASVNIHHIIYMLLRKADKSMNWETSNYLHKTHTSMHVLKQVA